MSIKHILIFGSMLALALSCSSPKPADQDGSILWFANSRPYGEILSSVETRVDGSLAPEGYHIYDEAGRRIVAGGSEAGVRYGVYALQRAQTCGPGRQHTVVRQFPTLRGNTFLRGDKGGRQPGAGRIPHL